MATSRFIGRDRELRALRIAYRSEKSEFLPVYGRRRVGKSELLLRFMRGTPHVYLVGKRAPAPLQVQEFLRAAAESLQVPLLETASRDDWKKALLTTVEQYRGGAKLIIALDEFQWTAEASPELTSVLQECWDRYWRDSGKVMLILCGSYVGFLERQVLGRRSPMFGRRTGQILLRPFGFQEAAGFHPSYSPVERARAYFVCGGIPMYLRYFDPAYSVNTNIARNFLDPFGPLFDEPEFLLREELREVENYTAILMSLAERQQGVTELARSSGVGRSVPYYLKQLRELGYVGRRIPLSGRRPPRSAVRYSLEDPLLRFWFRFVYPNRSRFAEDSPERGFHLRIKPDLESYFGLCFERLCREALPKLYLQDGVTARFDVGEYWDKHVQIDVVGVRDDGWIDLGECKWGTIRTAAGLVRDLETRARKFPNPDKATLGLRAFTRRRVRAVAGATCTSLEELYDAGE